MNRGANVAGLVVLALLAGAPGARAPARLETAHPESHFSLRVEPAPGHPGAGFLAPGRDVRREDKTVIAPADAVARAGRWAITEPREAAEWAVRLVDAAMREEALRGVFSEWASRDAAAAAEFLVARPPDDARWDAGKAAFVEARGWSEPELTPLWVALIVDAKARERAASALIAEQAD